MTTDGGLYGGFGRRLRTGGTALAAWSVLSEPTVVELLVREGFDAVVLDMQHGAHTVESCIQGIAAAALAGGPAIVRVPVGDHATASRMLDAGAAGVIAPMIDSVDDARAFAAFARYPPVGTRSWGPRRALPLSGLGAADYFAQANGLQLALPMIETRAALAALDAILAVPGIDGVFVGPADLSIALTGRLDPLHPEVDRALDHVAARARAAGKFAGLYCSSGKQARAILARGFALCSVASDAQLLGMAARAELADARQPA
jgi:4-hydroxy-2-oxoheptanedioate aldolase